MPGGGATLAIIAGRDLLPRLIAERCRAEGRPYLVIGVPGAAGEWMGAHPHERHEFERPGRLFAALRRAGCESVVFAGALDRPRLRPWRADARAAALLGRVTGLLARGDDALLSGLAEIFEAEGFRVVGAQECLAGLTAAPGVLGRHAPGRADRRDAALGAAILAALGAFDVGQAAVVAGGRCLGIEAAEGTDALLARLAGLAPARGGVLVKMAKPGQDRRFDLPAIGPRTIEGAGRAGLRGIAIEAGSVLVLDRPGTLAAADAAGLCLWSAARHALVR
ncbi:MAG TPA: UDP-2,3-diacylglucosamine diphosphatase LpxI [Thermohalobaculum sp.]|nr:UDP-2,3-diacylglucosamine diphosphatase LpxI [Thermohalobaculum sp.]